MTTAERAVAVDADRTIAATTEPRTATAPLVVDVGRAVSTPTLELTSEQHQNIGVDDDLAPACSSGRYLGHQPFIVILAQAHTPVDHTIVIHLSS